MKIGIICYASMGGRGIGSHLESALVNPLARELFAGGDRSGDRVTVSELRQTDGIWQVTLT